MQIIYEAADITEANIVCGMLQSQGIDAHAGGYYLQGAIGELAAQGHAKVYVADEDVEAAGKIIREYDSGACPESAGSEDSAFYRNIALWLIAAAVILFIIKLF